MRGYTFHGRYPVAMSMPYSFTNNACKLFYFNLHFDNFDDGRKKQVKSPFRSWMLILLRIANNFLKTKLSNVSLMTNFSPQHIYLISHILCKTSTQTVSFPGSTCFGLRGSFQTCEILDRRVSERRGETACHISLDRLSEPETMARRGLLQFRLGCILPCQNQSKEVEP